MRTLLKFLLLLGLADLPALAGDHAGLTRIVLRDEGPNIPAASFAAKEKIFYRQGEFEGRVEEAPDPSQHLQGVIIVNGKDCWLVNLWDKTAKHMVDPSVDHSFHAPILSAEKPNQPAPWPGFELGREVEFMEGHGVPPVAKDGALVYSYTEGAYSADLQVDATSKIPLLVEVRRDGKLMLRLAYVFYATLPADESLFQAPTGVTITEATPTH